MATINITFIETIKSNSEVLKQTSYASKFTKLLRTIRVGDNNFKIIWKPFINFELLNSYKNNINIIIAYSLTILLCHCKYSNNTLEFNACNLTDIQDGG